MLNKATLTGLFITLKATFNKAFATAPTVWAQIAMLVPSTTGQNDYAWLDKFPRMRRWIGDKQIKKLRGHKYTIVNEDFEATVEVDRNDIDDDTLGIYGPMAQAAGESSAQLPDELVAEAYNGAFTAECYDGQYFCDTDHPVKNPVTGVDTSVSNKITTALSIATLAAAQASYGVAKTMLQSFKDDEGRPLGCRPTVLMVPPALEDTANLLVSAERFGDDPNPYRGTARVVVNPWLTSDTAWFLLDSSKAVKPVVYQERKKPVFVSQVNPDSDDVFMRKTFKYGAEARAAVGYGFWQLCVGSTGTT